METDPDKARIMISVAVQLMKFKPDLAKGYVAEALAVCNKVDDFSGEDTTFNVRIESSLGDWQATYGTPAFSLTTLFRELANEDFFQARNTADILKNKELKSEALLTIARSVLQAEAKANTPSKQ